MSDAIDINTSCSVMLFIHCTISCFILNLNFLYLLVFNLILSYCIQSIDLMSFDNTISYVITPILTLPTHSVKKILKQVYLRPYIEIAAPSFVMGYLPLVYHYQR